MAHAERALAGDPRGWYKPNSIERSKVEYFCGFWRRQAEFNPYRQHQPDPAPCSGSPCHLLRGQERGFIVIGSLVTLLASPEPNQPVLRPESLVNLAVDRGFAGRRAAPARTAGA